MANRNYGQLLANLTILQKETIRKIENITKRICNAECAITFNEVCLTENLLPTYTLNIHSDEADNDLRQRRRIRPSNEERREYISRRISELRRAIEELRPQLLEAISVWNTSHIDDDLRYSIDMTFNRIIEAHRNAVVQRNKKKLVTLNGGQMKYPRPKPGYINLTTKTLTPDEEEILNMGLNCHMMNKPHKFQKRLECEVLIEDVEKLATQGKVTVEPTFRQEIIGEAAKTRGNHTSRIVEKRHIEAAKKLRSDPNTTIRKADKSAAYVLMNTDEYLDKLDTILSDTTKFKKMNKDSTEDLKKKVNQLIETNNAASNGTKLSKVIGEYKPGYCYGNVKTHKPGNKLRPIISQIPTPTYQLAKKLCKLLTPYIPSTFSLASATDFLDILKNSDGTGIMASLDAESLFTNLPVNRTIDFILEKIYHTDGAPDLNIPENILRALLECCTKEAPFICPRGNRYCQIDGVAMGSPLGVLFANFFMGSIEEQVFKNTSKPDIYCRYIDDIFIKAKYEHDIEDIRRRLQMASGLNFTIERSDEGTMPFLDVLIKQENEIFNTDVYIKPTNLGHCLNGASECPQRYKNSTIGAYIRRALTHCSTWTRVHHEIERASQVLISNGFSSIDIDKVTKKILDNWHRNDTDKATGEEIRIYYKGIFSTSYKEDERIMKNIMKKNVRPSNSEAKINFIIYYKSKKTSHLLLKNSPHQETDTLQKSHVVYRYICKKGNCEALPSTYVGMTTTKLVRRLTCHLYSGALRNHNTLEHRNLPKKQDLLENTEILATCTDSRRLPILEALFIKELSPSLNTQAQDLQALPSARRSALNGTTRATDVVTDYTLGTAHPSATSSNQSDPSV